MSLSWDDIVEASLLEPADKECETSPMLEEETILLGEVPELLEVQEAAGIPPRQSGDAQTGKTYWADLHSYYLCSSAPYVKTHHNPSQKAKKLWREAVANLNHAGEWVCSYMQKNEQVPDWWREFQSLLYSKDKHFINVQVKGLAC